MGDDAENTDFLRLKLMFLRFVSRKNVMFAAKFYSFAATVFTDPQLGEQE